MVASVTRLKAAAMTVHYFEADGYYAKNDPEHRKASGWHGEAAALLGLHGPVAPAPPASRCPSPLRHAAACVPPLRSYRPPPVVLTAPRHSGPDTHSKLRERNARR